MRTVFLFRPALIFVFVAVTTASARASTLDLLRQRLGALTGTTAVSGRIEVVEDASTEKKREVTRAGADFDCDASSLRLTVAAGDLAQPLESRQRPGAELISMTYLWGRLNSAPDLLRTLRRSTLLSDQPAVWKGQPARRLELKIDPEPFTDAPKFLKVKIDGAHHLWVTADGTPLAFEKQEKMTARLLIISATGSGKSTAEYSIVGDRLIVIRDVEESSSSGMGEKGQQKRTTTVTLRR